jgi:hypothetical protein
MREVMFIPSITNLKPYGNCGWQWTETTVSGPSIQCRTNKSGDGLWVVGPQEDKQSLGMCQFWLPSTRDAAYSKIRRFRTEYL